MFMTKNFHSGLVASALCLLTTSLMAADSGLQPGLIATVHDAGGAASFVTPTPNFNLKPGQSLHPLTGAAFQAEWTGVIHLVRAGKYTFHGDAQVLIDGKEVQGQPTNLMAGDLPLIIRFQRKGNAPARLRLEWESDFFQREPVPYSVLAHRDLPDNVKAEELRQHGRQLFEELNCAACHAGSKVKLESRRGPDLSEAGDRLEAAWIYGWLPDPAKFRSRAVMPHMAMTDAQRADVVAYLSTLKGPPPAKEKVGNAGKGGELFGKVGCLACHGKDGYTLDGLGSKWNRYHLTRFLMNPLGTDPSGRMPQMGLTAEEAAHLSAYLVKSKNKAFEASVPAGNASQGRTLVTSLGCVNCHTIKEGGKLLAPSLAGKALAALATDKGCLAKSPAGNVPQFRLTAEDRAALVSYVAKPDLYEAPVVDFHRLTSKFNCVACHELYGPAKLEFELNQAPPPLTLAGDKLRESWLEQVLNQNKRIRPWMNLRMPHFGPQNVGPLVQLFAAQSGAEFGEGLKIPARSPQVVQAAGKIVGQGDGGLSCINCHDFRGEKSGGEMRGPDLTEMYDRIRVDWLRRWLWEPSRLLPGTAMPAYFSDMPHDQATKMIGKIITALSAGKNMPIPEGLSASAAEYLLLVHDEPITFRTFIQDSPPRSIAVGLVGGQSYVFDAQNCYLNYAWTGDFLDVKPVWANRGGAPAKILGAKYYEAFSGPAIRIGEPNAQPKVRFRGYKLIQKIPEFMYEVDGVLVHERMTSLPNGAGLERHFKIDQSKRDVWFVGGTPKGVKLASSRGPLDAGRLKIPAGKNIEFTITVTQTR